MMAILFFSISLALAQPPSDVPDTAMITVEGVVDSFDDKIITVKQTNGVLVRIPRGLKPTLKGIKLKKDVLKFKVGSADFLKLNHEAFGLPKPK